MFAKGMVGCGYASIAAGGYSLSRHSLAVQSDGTLWAWGANWTGQLGDGSTDDRRTPVHVMDNVSAISTGGLHSLALTTDRIM